MKKQLLLIALIGSGITAQAQLKVGNNPATINTNSVLEIESTNKGLLLPRVALTGTANVAPLSAHIAGMSVYNTATAGNVTPGYYYNDGTKWVRLADALAADQSKDAWIDNTTSARVELGAKSTGAARTAGTEFVALDNGRVGIGTNTPANQLDVVATSNPLRLQGLQTGLATDQILTVDATGVVRKTALPSIVGTFLQADNILGTTVVSIAQGATADLPGATFTITPTVNATIIINVSALGLPTLVNAPVQGSIDLLQNAVKIASRYYSSADAPTVTPGGAASLVRLGNYSTISTVVELTAGTVYTFKLQAKSWYNGTTFNTNPVTASYAGAAASDADAMKASISYQLYTR